MPSKANECIQRRLKASHSNLWWTWQVFDWARLVEWRNEWDCTYSLDWSLCRPCRRRLSAKTNDERMLDHCSPSLLRRWVSTKTQHSAFADGCHEAPVHTNRRRKTKTNLLTMSRLPSDANRMNDEFDPGYEEEKNRPSPISLCRRQTENSAWFVWMMSDSVCMPREKFIELRFCECGCFVSCCLWHYIMCVRLWRERKSTSVSFHIKKKKWKNASQYFLCFFVEHWCSHHRPRISMIRVSSSIHRRWF